MDENSKIDENREIEPIPEENASQDPPQSTNTDPADTNIPPIEDKTGREQKPKHPGGRPSDYNYEKADYICEQLALGKSLNSITRDESMPSIATVYKWMRDKPEFLKKYEKAREDQVDTLADELIEIADDSEGDYITKIGNDGNEYKTFNGEHVQRARLRVDTRKWIAERMKPRKYGPKSDLNLGGQPDNQSPIRIAVFGDTPENDSPKS